MRIIKFKVLDKRTNVIQSLDFDGYTTSKDDDGVNHLQLSFGEKMHDDFCHTGRVDNYLLMQFTGLLDKKGEEIYEEVCVI